MYLEHFGLNELPFRLMPAPEFYSAQGARRQILDAVPALLRGGESVVCILGEAGMGKTLLCQRLAASLGEGVRAVTLSAGSVGAGEIIPAVLAGLAEDERDESGVLLWPARTLVRAVADTLERGPLLPLVARAVSGAASALAGLQGYEGAEASLARALRGLSRRILDLAENDQSVVLLVDDAHALSTRGFEALQLLADLEPEPGDRIQIILIGLPELSARLARPPAVSLGQRITSSFLLGPLSRREIEGYVEGRLALAGCAHSGLFTGAALDAALEASHGVPRLVNVVCHAALLQAYESGDDQVQRRHVRLAAAETDGAHRVVLSTPARDPEGPGLCARTRERAWSALCATGHSLQGTAERARAGLRSRRSVRLKLPRLGPPPRTLRAAKWAAVPLGLLLVAIPVVHLWMGGFQGARAVRQDAEEMVSEAIASLVEEPPLELPAVSKRSPLSEPPPSGSWPAPATVARATTAASKPAPGRREEPVAPVRRQEPANNDTAPSRATARRHAAAAAPAGQHRVTEPPPRRNSPRAAAAAPRRTRAAFGKTPHSPAATLREDSYRQALDLAAAGRDEEAVARLQQLLESEPEHERAREAQSALLIRTGRLDEAEKVLATGLMLAPGHPPFAKLQARILSERGSPAEALELLRRSPPPIARDPEYHALIAALYQMLGEHGLAADLYRQVLGTAPQNAAWWMGFGIALEGDGAEGSALLAYRAAAALASLGPDSRRYVESRISALGGDRR